LVILKIQNLILKIIYRLQIDRIMSGLLLKIQ